MKALATGDPIPVHTLPIHLPFSSLTFIKIPGFKYTRNHYPDYCDVGTDTRLQDLSTCIPGVYLAVYGDGTEREKERMERRGFQRESHPSFGYGEGGPPRFSIYLCPPYL